MDDGGTVFVDALMSSPVAGVNVQAERVPRRIQHHAYVVLGLVHVQLGSEREGVMHCGLEVGHTDAHGAPIRLVGRKRPAK